MASLRLPASLSSLEEFRELVRKDVVGLAPGADTGMLEMALEELLVNVVNYAYPDADGEIEVATETRGDAVDIAISDNGIAYDPTTETAAPDLEAGIEERAIGGLGVFLAQQVFASMEYQRDGHKNVLNLRYVVPDSPPS